jgi:hypothetical protein
VGLKENLASINDRIDAACTRAGRDRQEVHLIAVSKTVPAERVRQAIEGGVRILGENRVQEAAEKIAALKPDTSHTETEWHLIGHLQSNKARRAVELFDAIHTIDSLKLAERISQFAGEMNKRMPVFIEVNLGEESSKAGIGPEAALPLIEAVGKLDHVTLKGLMAVPPFFDYAKEVRPYFRRLRNLREEARAAGIAGPAFCDLSMGMSNDFEVAIEEGATFVRVGTAIFGARS